jgi:hypothetical protein
VLNHALPGKGAGVRRGLADDHSLRTSKLVGGGGARNGLPRACPVR